MTLPEMIVLAVVQGLTEFLPISSSGHLVLANAILGLAQPGIAVEIVLHLGTLAAVVLYFRRDLAQLARSAAVYLGGGRGERERASIAMVLALAVGTAPSVAAGLLAKSRLESLYENPRQTSIELLVTALILLSTLLVRRGARPVSIGRALVIGFFQALSLLPGVSRSGATISGGLYLRIRPEEAARFSFLLSIPAILGAIVLEAPAVLREAGQGRAGLLLAGCLISFALGYLSIAALLKIVGRGRFGFFGIYCLLVGIAGLALLR